MELEIYSEGNLYDTLSLAEDACSIFSFENATADFAIGDMFFGNGNAVQRIYGHNVESVDETTSREAQIQYKVDNMPFKMELDYKSNDTCGNDWVPYELEMSQEQDSGTYTGEGIKEIHSLTGKVYFHPDIAEELVEAFDYITESGNVDDAELAIIMSFENELMLIDSFSVSLDVPEGKANGKVSVGSYIK